MDIYHLDRNHLGGPRAPNFYNGIQLEENIEGEREKFLLLVLEEVVVVVEDRPDRAEATTGVQTTLRQQRHKLPGQQNLVETR